MKKVVFNNKFLFIYSMLEAFSLIYGDLLTRNLSIKNFNMVHISLMLIDTIILFLLNLFIMKMIDKKRNSNTVYSFSWKKVILYFFILILFWTPVLLAYYPGVWGYDVGSQLPHITDKYSMFTHITSQHPITHTLFLELFIMIGKIFHNYVLGILLATIAQMIIVSLSLSFCIEKVKTYMKNKTVIKVFTVLSILFYGIMPFSSVMAISSTKDVLFSSFFIISLIHLYDFFLNNNSNKKIIYFFIFTILSLLFKNNYFIIFIITLIILIIYLKRDIILQRKVVKYGVITIMMFYSINFIYNIFLVPEKTGIWEGMSIQVNTICQTTKKHPELVEEYTHEGILFEVLNIDFIPEDYCFKYLSDPMKGFFNDNAVENPNIFKFIITWGKIGLKYPAEYFDAFSNLNRGAWYLLDESYADIYQGKKDISGYLSTTYALNLTSTKPVSKFPWLYDKLERILTDNIYLDNILFKIVLSPSFYILIVFYFLFLGLDQKNKKTLIFFIPIICLYINLLIGPCTIVRYVYVYMILVPILIGIYFGREQMQKK